MILASEELQITAGVSRQSFSCMEGFKYRNCEEALEIKQVGSTKTTTIDN